MSESMVAHRTRRLMNLAAGAAFGGLGLFLVVAARQFEDAGRSTPTFIGYGLVVLSIVLVVVELVRSDWLPVPDAEEGSGRRRLVFVILMLLWILVLPYLGFIVAGSLMFAIIAAAVPRSTPWTGRSLALHAVAGILTTVGFWLVLTKLLIVPLPTSTLF